MSVGRSPLTRSDAWRALAAHHRQVRDAHLRDLFAADPERGRRLALDAASLYLDYSKNRVTDQTIALLVALAEQSGLRARIEAAFGGEDTAHGGPSHTTAGNIASRTRGDPSIVIVDDDGTRTVQARMAEFAEKIRGGAWTGFSGKRIRNVINIAAGSLDLGPAMAYQALKAYSDRGLTVRFVSNGDGGDFAEATRDLDPAETLFIVCSRSFATRETLTNARWAKEWLFRALPRPAPLTAEDNPFGDGPTEIELLFAAQDRALAMHFAYVSASLENVARFGGYVPYDPNNYYGRPAKVRNLFMLDAQRDGHHILGTAAALSTIVAVGPEHFQRMLAGFEAMDEHFRGAPFERNMPVLLALLGIWYAGFFGAETTAVLPHDQYLSKLVPYLQYLDMQRNRQGVDYPTAPITWGAPGAGTQHAVMQMLQHGARLVPCDFIGVCQTLNPIPANPSYPARDRDMVIASMLAQAESLAFGQTAAQAADGIPKSHVPFQVLEGNRPSNTILAPRLTPETLGALIALYEHKAFAQRVIWRLDRPEPAGESPGSALTWRLIRELESGRASGAPHDSSTNALIAWHRAHRGDDENA
jgi:glucose-6-phosphate isomerase